MKTEKLISCITHEESTIHLFMEDPEFADYLMNEVLADGDTHEIAHFQALYDEAQARLMGLAAEA